MTKEELIKIMARPAYERDNLAVSVERIYTDVQGKIVDKATVIAALPQLECETPVFLFGEYDRKGGYLLAQKNYPATDALKFLSCMVYGVTNPFFFGANALTDIQTKCKPGDILQVWTNDLLAPTYYVWVKLSSALRSLASFMENLPALPRNADESPVNISKLKYYSTNPLQWTEEMQVLWSDYMGLVNSNHAHPIIYRGPYNYDNGFVQMNIELILSQYVGLNTYMLFDTDSITYNFNLLINKKCI